MTHQRLARAVLPCLSFGLAACDVFYTVQARVPLNAPINSDCLRSKFGPDSKQALSNSRQSHTRGNRITAESFATDAMFHDRWQTVTQTSHHDSSVFLGAVYRDTSATLSGTFVSVNRRFDSNRGAAMGEEMAALLLDARDACGGRSPSDERPYSVEVNEVPYESWVIGGSGGRLSVRVTVDAREYTGPIVRRQGTYILHLDTLAERAQGRAAKRVEVDRVDVPALPDGSVLATECWRDDSASTGNVIAQARSSDDEYWRDIRAAWEVDAVLLRIRPTPVSNVECLNRRHWTQFPSAPRAMRRAAVNFEPSAGMSRVYAYLPGISLESNVATVTVDGEVVGELDGGSYLMVEISPGKHTVAAVTAHQRNEVSLDLRPGSSAFVQLHWKKWSWTQQATIEIDTTAAMRERIRDGHMVASSWPGTPLATDR